LVPSWRIGDRSSETAIAFADDLASRLRNRVQITTDGYHAYLEAIEGAFGAGVDYAMLVKVCGQAPEGQQRYSPPLYPVRECLLKKSSKTVCFPLPITTGTIIPAAFTRAFARLL
jgi:hypothetical protein